jgi:hypothetical protein
MLDMDLVRIVISMKPCSWSDLIERVTENLVRLVHPWDLAGQKYSSR